MVSLISSIRSFSKIFLGFFAILLIFPVGCGSPNSGQTAENSVVGATGASTDSHISQEANPNSGNSDGLPTPPSPSSGAPAPASAPANSGSASTAVSSAPTPPNFLDEKTPYNLVQVALGDQEIVNFDEWALDGLNDWCRAKLRKTCDLAMTQDGVPTSWLLLYAIRKNPGLVSASVSSTGATPATFPLNLGARLPFDMVQAALGLDETVRFDGWVLDSLDGWSRVNLHKPADLAMSQDGVPTAWLQLYLISKTHV